MRVFDKCIQEAKSYGENLFPSDCMDILINNYGKRLDYMEPERIYKKLNDLMDVKEHTTEEQEFADIILPYIKLHERKHMLSFQDTDMQSVIDAALLIQKVLEKEDIIIKIHEVKFPNQFLISVSEVLPGEEPR